MPREVGEQTRREDDGGYLDHEMRLGHRCAAAGTPNPRPVTSLRRCGRLWASATDAVSVCGRSIACAQASRRQPVASRKVRVTVSAVDVRLLA